MERDCISKCKKSYGNSMRKTSAGNEEESQCTTNHVSGEGKIRLLYCLIHDEVMPLCRQAQNSLSRVQVDVRNSLSNMITFQETAAAVWNDTSFILESRTMPNPHDKFKTELVSSKPEGATINADEVKTTTTLIKPKMFGVIFDYEKSGNRSGQRNEDDPNWGKFTLDACVDGDDRANFLPNRNKDWIFLCW